MTTAVTTGAGNDKITSDGTVGTGGSVNAGDGIDTIVMASAEAATADGDSTFNTKFTNFEVLELSDVLGTSTTLDLRGLNNVTDVTLTNGGNDVSSSILDFVASGATIKQSGNGTGVTIQVNGASFNATDVINLALSKSSILAAGTITVPNVETININTDDAVAAGSTAAKHTLTLAATKATSIVVSGNNGLTLTNNGANDEITNFNASGVVANGTADTAANLAVQFVNENDTASEAVTVTGGAGNDVLTGSTVANAITFTGGEGADTITSGAGNDNIILTETTAAADTVAFLTTASNGVDTVTGFAAGSGADIVDIVAGATTVTTASGSAAVIAAPTNTTLTNGAAAFALTGASSTTSDVIEITATLSSFGDLDKAGVTNGAELLKALSSTNTAATSITATTASDDFFIIAYQDGDAFLYQVTNDDTTVLSSEIALVAKFVGITAGAFASGDFTIQ
jgi:S-layer protein